MVEELSISKTNFKSSKDKCICYLRKNKDTHSYICIYCTILSHCIASKQKYIHSGGLRRFKYFYITF